MSSTRRSTRLSRLWTLAPEAWASWVMSRSEWDDRASPCHVRYWAGIVMYNSARSRPLTVLIVGSRCGLSRACTRFYGLSRLWTLAPEAWASWATSRSEWDDRVSPSDACYPARNVVYNSAKISPSHRLDRRFSMRSVITCMHALLRTLTLMDIGTRGMGELGHKQERVGRPSLAF
jgi:hypothetical protein